MLPRPEFLYGIHDTGGEYLMLETERPGWIVVTERVGTHATRVLDYKHLADSGLGVIVRLNHGYYPDGTIPAPIDYDKYADACARSVSNSIGCRRWIIGNEPNHVQERPGGEPIVPLDYANCFKMCRDAIKALPSHENDEVITAAIAPWDCSTTYGWNRSGDWLAYFSDMLNLLCDQCDGIALHAYTHGFAPRLIYSDVMLLPPFQDRFYHWRAYTQFMERIPISMRHLPVYITEADNCDYAWSTENTGWVQTAYGDINWWNEQPGTQKILALCLYRWQPHDCWSFKDNNGVIADFQKAMERGYRVPEAPQPAKIASLPAPQGSWNAMVNRIKQAADRAEELATDLREVHRLARWFGGDF